jgi:ATP-binding cassette subfamily F protein 1
MRLHARPCKQVTSLTLRAKGKLLLESTNLTIAAGRRYGLAGPNGKGKSTLLRLLAKRQIPVPDGIDVLLVEQEIVGSEASALMAVVEADVELMALRDEEKELTAKLLDPDAAKEEDEDFVQEDAQVGCCAMDWNHIIGCTIAIRLRPGRGKG